ncbi:MAG: hypothetical protein CM1200mP13_04410 [Candidatus Pelagibacterales bacterium]|nr:MAG: hypothetical protein CM1200mP13_04410 [Pelagibacterales bacterium]
MGLTKNTYEGEWVKQKTRKGVELGQMVFIKGNLKIVWREGT